MTIMSPSTCSQALNGQAVTYAQGSVLIVDLSLARVVQHSSYAFAYTVQAWVVCIKDRVHMVQCMRMTTITLRVQNLTLSSLKWSPHKHIYIHIKPLPVSCVFGARSGSPRIIITLWYINLIQMVELIRPSTWWCCSTCWPYAMSVPFKADFVQLLLY